MTSSQHKATSKWHAHYITKTHQQSAGTSYSGRSANMRIDTLPEESSVGGQYNRDVDCVLNRNGALPWLLSVILFFRKRQINLGSSRNFNARHSG